MTDSENTYEAGWVRTISEGQLTAEIERLRNALAASDREECCDQQKAAMRAEVERLRATCEQLEQDREYNSDLVRERDTEINGLRVGIAAIAEQLNCEQKAGTICSCIRALQRELNRIGGEHARAISATIPDLQAEIERLRKAIAWLRSNIIPNAGAGQPFAYVWQEKWEQFEAMIDGETNR